MESSFYKKEVVSKNGATYLDQRVNHSFITRVKNKLYEKVTDSIATVLILGASSSILFAWNGYKNQKEMNEKVLGFIETQTKVNVEQMNIMKLQTKALEKVIDVRVLEGRLSYLEGIQDSTKTKN